MSELLRALAELTSAPGPETERLAGLLRLPTSPTLAEHTRLFEILLYPRASVYLGSEGMFGGEAEDRIAGFWRALGAEVPAEPDHLRVLLCAYAELADAESASTSPDARIRHARTALLWEHIASWVPVYAKAVIAHGTPHHRAWGELLEEAVAGELASLVQDIGPGPGVADLLPLHLREAAGLADPREAGGDAFVAGLLAPARTGFILTRADLARACEELGLGLRQGERRYVLRAMLGQDPAASLGWLARFAQVWEDRHRSLCEELGVIRAFWRERAGAAASLLSDLSVEQSAAVLA